MRCLSVTLGEKSTSVIIHVIIHVRYHSRGGAGQRPHAQSERSQACGCPSGPMAGEEGVEPTPYQLLTGSQIHQVQLWLRKMERAELKPEPTLAKELTFSSNIGQHDLDTKSKQIQQWIKKKYKVQITIKKGKNEGKPEKKKKKMQETIESSRQCLLSSNFLIQALAH